MFKIEKKIINFFERHYIVSAFILITIITLLIKYFMLDNVSADYDWALSYWFGHFKEKGFKGLANYRGNYNAVYMTLMALLSYIPMKKLYLIKILSIVFDYVLAVASVLLVKELVGNKKFILLLTYFSVLFIPSVFLNSAMWAQCDSIYCSFVIFSLLFLLKKKYILSFIMLGVSFAFKLQFIFILPLYIVIYLSQKKFSILHFFIIPIVDIILCLPAVFAGMPFKKIFTVYIKQAQDQTTNKLSMNFHSLYNILVNKEIYYKIGVLIVIAICFMMLIYIIVKKVKWNNEKIITLGLWFLVVVTFMLPGMHDRYMFVGEVLGIIYYIAYRKNLPLIISINIISLLTYSVYLNGLSYYYRQLFTIIYLVVIIYFTKNVIRLLSESE